MDGPGASDRAAGDGQAEADDGESRLRLALLATGTGVCDVRLPCHDGFFSDEYLRIFGYDASARERFAGGWQPLVHPGDVARFVRYRDEVQAGLGDHYDGEFRRMHASGRWTWVRIVVQVIGKSDDGRPLRVVGTVHDVDARRRAEAALQSGADALADAQRIARVGSWQWQVDGDRVAWSRTLFEILGRDPGGPAVPYADHAQLYVPESWARLRDAVAAALASGATYELELEFVRGDGSRGWGVARGEVLRDEDGRIVGLRGTLQDITGRKRDEIALCEARDEVRRLSAHVEDELDRERKRIALDVHDELGQRLTAMRLRLELLEAGSPAGDAATRRALAELRALVDETLEVTRHVAIDLRPPALDLGLVAALEWLVEDFGLRTEIARVELDAPGGDIALDDRHALLLFRIVQESLTNVARHAAANAVRVRLTVAQARLVLEVSDDGRGFDPAGVPPAGHFGLLGLRERALRLGAELQIRSAPDAGTRIVLELPYPPPSLA